jgi:hypothetical protein
MELILQKSRETLENATKMEAIIGVKFKSLSLRLYLLALTLLKL